MDYIIEIIFTNISDEIQTLAICLIYWEMRKMNKVMVKDRRALENADEAIDKRVEELEKNWCHHVNSKGCIIGKEQQ